MLREIQRVLRPGRASLYLQPEPLVSVRGARRTVKCTDAALAMARTVDAVASGATHQPRRHRSQLLA